MNPARFLVAAAAVTGTATAQFRQAPLAYSGSSDWVLDSKVSDLFSSNFFNAYKWQNAFYSDSCTPARQTAGTCAAEWHGLSPTVVHRSNVAIADGKLELTLRETSGLDSAFAAANAATGATGPDESDCDCSFGGSTTGLIKSRNLVRGGYIEVTMQMPANADVTGSIWLQSANVDISAVSLRGTELTTSGFIFDTSSTVQQAEVTSTVQDPSGAMVTYGVEWRINNDVVIHRDGAAVHTLAGSAWNPGNAYADQELNLIVDLQVAAGADADTVVAAGPSVLKVDDVHVFEADCVAALGGDFSFEPAASQPSNPAVGVVGTGAGCAAGIFANMCVDFNRGLCTNPNPGQAVLTTWGDVGACAGINLAGYCGGALDNRGDHPGADSDTWRAGRGTVGNCVWDWTAAKTTNGGTSRGKCIGTSSVDLSKVTEPAKCGGNNGVPDATGGQGMWCFGKCLRRTEFNPVGTKYWNNLCMSAYNYDGVDMCEAIGLSAGTYATNDAGARVYRSDYKTCMARSDTGSKRSRHCFMQFRAASSAPVGSDGTKVQGVYCTSRDPTKTNPSQGGVAIWQYNAFGRDKCEAAGNAWVCATRGGIKQMSCKRAGTAAEGGCAAN